jgi:ferrous iron transport protein B
MSEVFLVGRPNVGKSYIFNALTGANQKIGNFAGVTVEKKSKHLSGSDLIITDLPGIYTLKATSNDEKVTLQYLNNSSPEDLVCVVIECLKFKTQLPYILELRKWCTDNYRPMILCLNMKDEADKFGIHFDLETLQALLQIPVFLVSAKTKQGLPLLVAFLNKAEWLAPEPIETHLLEDLKNTVQGDMSKVLLGQTRLDSFFLSPIYGPLIFLFFTFMLFQSIFSWAEPFMNSVEFLIASLSDLVSPYFSGHFRSFLDNAIFAGFGAFLVFTPQIFMLTFILTFLEKSGYMARAVLICHQPLSWFGLHGKSFIPMMTGHACAVPAIYATRNIENNWVRKLTIFVLPLTVCSARIPVYALLIKVLIPNKSILFGLLGLQGFVFFMMYFFGLFLALLISALVTKWANQPAVNDDFIVELPQYRWPELKILLLKGLKTTWDFIKDAGPIIFVLNASIWLLSYLPSGSADLKSSYLAKIGHFLEPIFTPIGLDWLQGVAVLSSFVAREVFVSTLGLLYGLSAENTDDVINVSQIQNISLASGLSLLCFFAIALQCMSTVSVMAKETSNKLAFTALGFYLVLAYFLSFCIYQLLS